VIAQPVDMNDPELFCEYYSLFFCPGSCTHSKESFVECCSAVYQGPRVHCTIDPFSSSAAEPSGYACIMRKAVHYHFWVLKFPLNEYIIREFCPVACDVTLIFHCLLILACERSDLAEGYQRQVNWLRNNLQVLEWNTSNAYIVSHIRHLFA